MASVLSPGESLPLDLIVEILYRLPVKLLLQLRCVCKSWNSLISDPKFAKKHLTYSTTLGLHFLTFFNPSRKFILTSYPLDTVFTNDTTNFTQLEYPQHNVNGIQYHILSGGLDYFVGSCHGILCLTNNVVTLVLLWNPSIRKYKELPLFQMPENSRRTNVEYSFGYDHVNDVYKVVAVLSYVLYDVHKTEVKVHILGTDFWKSIHEFPFGGVAVSYSGQFVGGAINWLAYNDSHCKGPSFIVSFDLEKESYQQILQPDYQEINASACQLGVWKDCMWVSSGHDVWLMKEYGNKESWTKLFTISCDFTEVINILDDDQVLLEYMNRMIVYNFKNDTFKLTEFEIKRCPQISVESLISPLINLFTSHKLKKQRIS